MYRFSPANPPVTPPKDRKFHLPASARPLPRETMHQRAICTKCARGIEPCLKHGFLGGGQFGKVWIAVETEHADLTGQSTKPLVALKVMNHINKFGEDMYESAICTELAVHRKVTEVLCDSCPYLLPLLDVYHDVDSTTMVLPGLMPDLLTVCMQRKFSEDEASEVVRQLAEALAALHAIGIAHCDVKPENLALCPRRGHMVLFDFGLALTDVAPPRVVAGKVRGTVAFLSPEVLRDHVYGSAADMWALGAVLYVMLTQSYPFRDPRATCQVRYNIDNVRQCSGGGGQERDQCSSELLHLLEALFVVDPARRASAHDVLAHPWLGQGGGGGRVEGRGSACEVEVEVEGMQDTNCLAA